MKQNLSTREAANYLAEQGTPFSVGTLEVWRHYRKGPSFKKIGKKVFYTPAALDKFIQGQTILTIDSV